MQHARLAWCPSYTEQIWLDIVTLHKGLAWLIESTYLLLDASRQKILTLVRQKNCCW